MDSYRIINRELTQKNRELKQAIWGLTKERNDLTKKILVLEQINFKLENTFSTILEATRTYSVILQHAYKDYISLSKRTTNVWSINRIDHRKNSSSYSFRDTTNLQKRRTHERTWHPGGDNKSVFDESLENDDENETSAKPQIEMESLKHRKDSEFLTRRKTTITLDNFIKDMEIEEEPCAAKNETEDSMPQISHDGLINMEEAPSQNVTDASAVGLRPIVEESTGRNEMSISLIKSQNEEIVDIVSISEDDTTTNTNLEASMSLGKTSYTSNMMQLTDVQVADINFVDFRQSKMISSTPNKGRKPSINFNPKVIVKRISKTGTRNHTSSNKSTENEDCKSMALNNNNNNNNNNEGEESPKIKISTSNIIQSPLPSTSNERPRRRAAPLVIKEPKLNTKMRNCEKLQKTRKK